MADIKISDMLSASVIDSGDYIELSQNVGGSQTSTKTTIGDLASAVMNLSFVEVTDTLAIGATSLTLQDASITSNSTIDIYTDTFGVNPTNVSVTTGQIVLTFEAQANAVNVKARIS